MRVIVNAMTRMRFCTESGAMDFSAKGGIDAAPAGHRAWFEVPGRRSAASTVVCGHWSALGLRIAPRLMALDTGCVWGGSLSAVRLDDRRIFQVKCPGYQSPGGE
jgi:bis(5'-nucleosyl)-tetraphosphatase (symmetrical)